MAFHLEFGFIKRHPIGSTVAVVVGGLVLYLLLTAGKGSSSSASSDPQGAATQQQNTALLAQQDAEQAQYNQQALAGATAQNLATIQSYQAITLAEISSKDTELNINKSADIQSQAIAAQLAEATLQSNNQTQVQMAGIAANAQMQQNQLQAAVDQTNIMAGLQAHITDTNDALQAHLVDTTTQYQQNIAQINANTQIDIANSNNRAASHASDNSMWGTIATAAIMAFI